MSENFSLFGYTIERTTAQENYNCIRVKAEDISYLAKKKFKEGFSSTMSNMDEVINKLGEYSRDIIMEAINKYLNILSANDIYTYDVSRFIEKSGSTLNPIADVIGEIEDIYDDIEQKQRDEQEYREERKASRGRMVGGGYGLGGAAKGMLAAGAFNATTGIFHSVVNLAGDATSAYSAYKSKSSLYNKCCDSLAPILRDVVFNLHYTLVEILKEKMNFELLSEDAYKKYSAIFNNIKNKSIPEDKIQEQAIKIIEIYPYDEEFYSYLLEQFGDENREIEIIAEHFNCSIMYDKINYVENKFLDINFVNSYELKKSKEDIVKWCNRVGLDNKKYIEVIDNIIDIYDKKYNEFDGMTYENKEDAIKARKELIQIMNKVEDLNGNQISQVESIIDELSQTSCKSKDKYVEYLQEAIDRAKKRRLEVKGTSYTSEEDANLARKEAKELDQLFGENDFNSYEKVENTVAIVEKYTTNIKENYLKRLEMINEVRVAQNDLYTKNQSGEFNNRKEWAVVAYEGRKLNELGRKLGWIDDNFNEWINPIYFKFVTYTGRYVSKNEEAYSAISINRDEYRLPRGFNECNKQYYKGLEKAISYKKYIDEKNNPNKGFFASLKNKVSGVFQTDYDYKYLTNDGKYALPKGDTEEYDQTVELCKEIDNKYMSLESKVEYNIKWMLKSASLDDEFLSLLNLVEAVEPVDIEKIKELIKTVLEYNEVKMKNEEFDSHKYLFITPESIEKTKENLYDDEGVPIKLRKEGFAVELKYFGIDFDSVYDFLAEHQGISDEKYEGRILDYLPGEFFVKISRDKAYNIKKNLEEKGACVNVIGMEKSKGIKVSEIDKESVIINQYKNTNWRVNREYYENLVINLH